MNLSLYVETVRSGVTQAAALGDDHTRYVAEQLASALDAATRLALISALSDAAAAISADLAPTSVELRMTGTEPEFVVAVPEPLDAPVLLVPEPDPEVAEPASEEFDEEEPVARVSLRLPQSVKARVDERADGEGISTNAWLIRAVMDALAESGRTSRRPGSESFPPLFGPNGPFGEHGVFGPHGPFGGGGDRRPQGPGDGGKRSRGNVQGWVR